MHGYEHMRCQRSAVGIGSLLPVWVPGTELRLAGLQQIPLCSEPSR